MTTQIEASDLVGAVAGLVPGSPLAEARGSRAVARDQIQAAESALFTRGTATIPRRDRLIVGAFAAALTDPDGALAVHRVGQLADADAALVDRLVDSGAQQGPWGSYREPGLIHESVPGQAWTVPERERAELGAALSAVLEHAHLLLLHPRDARPGSLQTLVDVGWGRSDIVTWSQLISFAAFQARLAAGLAVTQEALT
jgi:CMD domain protein